MTSRGRPRRVTPGMLAEAASELFLEQGYHDTAIEEITGRAGVSRATFFNYFPAKADVLFESVDQALADIELQVAEGVTPLDAVLDVARGISSENLPLIATQAEAMSVGHDVAMVGPARVERLRKIMEQQFPNSFDHWLVTAAIVSAATTWATAQPPTGSLQAAIEASVTRVIGSL